MPRLTTLTPKQVGMLNALPIKVLHIDSVTDEIIRIELIDPNNLKLFYKTGQVSTFYFNEVTNTKWAITMTDTTRGIPTNLRCFLGVPISKTVVALQKLKGGV